MVKIETSRVWQMSSIWIVCKKEKFFFKMLMQMLNASIQIFSWKENETRRKWQRLRQAEYTWQMTSIWIVCKKIRRKQNIMPAKINT